MTDIGDRIDVDFALPESAIDPREFNPYRETLRVCDRILALLERVIEENGTKP